jgi:hypothetical protein
MNEHSKVIRALVRPGVYMALKKGRWKKVAGAYFWAVSPLVRWIHANTAGGVSGS